MIKEEEEYFFFFLILIKAGWGPWGDFDGDTEEECSNSPACISWRA